MQDAASQGEYLRLKKNISRLGELPVVRYLRWSRYTKGIYKNTFKGLLKSLKGVAFLLVLLASAREIPYLPLGMGLIVILLGLKGIFNLARGLDLMIKVRKMAKKVRGERVNRKWRYILLWTNMTFLIILLSSTFLFTIERLSAPQEIRGDQEWYVWPFIYLGMFIIWSIIARSMVLGGARAFKVGDRLARVQHDRALFKKTNGWKQSKKKFVLLAGYVPVIGLAFMLFLIVLLKLLLRFLMKLAFDIDKATSIGEEGLRLAFGRGTAMNDLHPFFGTWYGPLILYLGVIILIGVFSNLRTRAIIRSYHLESYHSHMGQRIKLAKELKKNWK
jgi:hypothetical protein